MADSRDGPDGRIYQLSCALCRQRKVKCNRIYPCTHCVRAGAECHFPSRKRNKPRRKPQQNELLSRLARLEEIVAKVDPDALADHVQSKQSPPKSGYPDDSMSGLSPLATLGEDSPAPQGEEPSKQNTPASRDSSSAEPSVRYLGRDFWTNLCNEFDGLKQALEQPSDEDDEDDAGSGTTPESQGQTSVSEPSVASAAYLSGQTPEANGPPSHPSKEQIETLCDVYFTNVDLCMKILHRPTMQKLLASFASVPTAAAVDIETEALFFAMYYAAVTSLSPELCLAKLGEDKKVLSSRYRAATELALGRADYLNNSKIEVLQAFTLLVGCLRCHGESRASWALLGLAIRLAQADGLHMDGDGKHLAPFESEMRRRLWWCLIGLDIRAGMDRGTDAIITGDAYDTAFPTNIGDDDFGPDSTAPLQAREGPTDITLFLCFAMSSGSSMYLFNPGKADPRLISSHVPFPDDAAGEAPRDTEAQVMRTVQLLESHFVHNADRTFLPSAVAERLTRSIILRLWLGVQYPLSLAIGPPAATPSASKGDTAAGGGGGPAQKPFVSRASILRTATAIMELTQSFPQFPGAEHVLWWTRTYPQWHALAVALAELCVQTRGELVDRAWRSVELAFGGWGRQGGGGAMMLADDTGGGRGGGGGGGLTLWRPMRKLLRKARQARSDALMASQLPGMSPPAQEVDSARAGTEFHPLVEEQIKQSIEGGVVPGRDQGESPHGISGPEATRLESFSPMNFVGVDPTEWLTTDVSQNPAAMQDLMDWSTWNEFLNDTYTTQDAAWDLDDATGGFTDLGL